MQYVVHTMKYCQQKATSYKQQKELVSFSPSLNQLNKKLFKLISTADIVHYFYLSHIINFQSLWNHINRSPTTIVLNCK